MSWWNATTVLHYVGGGGGGVRSGGGERGVYYLLAGKYLFNLVPSRLFHSFGAEPIIRWAKTGDPREKPPDHLQAEFGFSHMWPELGSNPQRWDDERFRLLKFSGLNHSATGAASWQTAFFFFFFFFFFAKVGVWGTQTPEISKVRNTISYDSLDHLRAFLFRIRTKKNNKTKQTKINGKKWSQEPVSGGALGRRWVGWRGHSN